MDAETVRGYLGRLRRRAWAVAGLRALVALAGTTVLAFVCAAAIVGPVVSLEGALVAWGVVTVVAGGIVWLTLRPARRLRGPAVAQLLSEVRVDLVSQARSAFELEGDDDARTVAPGLVAAHAARVREALAGVPIETAVPWRRARDATMAAGLVALALAAISLKASDRVASGVFALAHPAAHDARGHAVAAVLGRVEARLVFPSYLDRPPATLTDPVSIEAPRGTTVQLRARPRVAVRDGVLETPGSQVRLSRRRDGQLEGGFVVRADGTLRVRVRETSGRWLIDPSKRSVRAVRDQAPRVVMIAPASDSMVEADEEVAVVYDARDDVGLDSVDLVVRGADGRAVRRRLASFDVEGSAGREASRASERLTPQTGGDTSVVASAFGAQAGDRLTIWIEARDGDVVSGPNVGRSAERVLTVASDALRHEQNLATLEQVLDAALHTLADRLEQAVPEDDAHANARFSRMRAQTDVFTTALDGLLPRLERDRRARRADSALYGAMANRVRRLLTQETRLHGTHVAPKARRDLVDGKTVEELESDSLLLADLIMRARIEDAASLTRELEQLRRSMSSLLAELRRTDDESARRELLAEIGRAEARMRELMARLGELAHEVPSDFINTEALPDEDAAAELDRLREAVERGDLEDAERRLAALERQIGRIAEALGSADQEFTEARFGPRERAMAEALDALHGLETEQNDLAHRSSDVRRRAAERASRATQGRVSDAARRLAQRAHAARGSLDRVDEHSLAMVDQEARGRARQRMIDTEDALRSGDLGEARRMADEASDDVNDLARDLEIEARMFPGPDGRTARSARAARDAASQLRELRQSIYDSMPQTSDYVDDSERRQLRQDSSRQRRVSEAAGRLARRFGEGPDGTPLSPDGQHAVEDAQGSMRQAEQALGRGDPRDAARAQEDAARRLSELREQLERERQSQGSRASGGGEGGDGALDFRRPVHIPGADEFAGPMERRRRLLDAMREGAPSGYEERVRRYYEELLE